MSYVRRWQQLGKRHPLWGVLERGATEPERVETVRQLLERLEQSESAADEITLTEAIAEHLLPPSLVASTELTLLLSRAKNAYFDGLEQALVRTRDASAHVRNAFLRDGFEDLHALLAAIHRTYVLHDYEALDQLSALTGSRNYVVADLAMNYVGLVALQRGDRTEAERCLASVQSLRPGAQQPLGDVPPSGLLAQALGTERSG
jgi:hypothetical protein